MAARQAGGSEAGGWQLGVARTSGRHQKASEGVEIKGMRTSRWPAHLQRLDPRHERVADRVVAKVGRDQAEAQRGR